MVSATLLVLICCLSLEGFVHANPQIDALGGYDSLGMCFNNCAQCKKLYGAYFEGQRCAESCITYKGKIIPDCEDVGSIGRFLNSLDMSK